MDKSTHPSLNKKFDHNYNLGNTNITECDISVQATKKPLDIFKFFKIKTGDFESHHIVNLIRPKKNIEFIDHPKLLAQLNLTTPKSRENYLRFVYGLRAAIPMDVYFEDLKNGHILLNNDSNGSYENNLTFNKIIMEYYNKSFMIGEEKYSLHFSSYILKNIEYSADFVEKLSKNDLQLLIECLEKIKSEPVDPLNLGHQLKKEEFIFFHHKLSENLPDELIKLEALLDENIN